MGTTFDSAVERAAALLREEADAHKESCSVGKHQWRCEGCDRDNCPSERRYNELRAAAQALVEAA